MRLRVRVFANEDIYFYVKRIDNSRGVREADPAGARDLLEADRFGGGGGGAAGGRAAAERLRVARRVSDPIAAPGSSSGWRRSRRSLELKEATLLSPARMEELARTQQFIDPPAQKVVYLDSKGGSLAMNGAMIGKK